MTPVSAAAYSHPMAARIGRAPFSSKNSLMVRLLRSTKAAVA